MLKLFHFILSYLNTKTLFGDKRKRKTIAIPIDIYLHIRSYKFAGLPRDRALGRMLILQEFLQFPSEYDNRATQV